VLHDDGACNIGAFDQTASTSTSLNLMTSYTTPTNRAAAFFSRFMTGRDG
jgi:hypothetical protein